MPIYQDKTLPPQAGKPSQRGLRDRLGDAIDAAGASSKALAALEQRTTALEASRVALDGQIQALAVRLATVESHLTALSARCDEIQRDLACLRERVDDCCGDGPQLRGKPGGKSPK